MITYTYFQTCKAFNISSLVVIQKQTYAVSLEFDHQ